MMLLCVFYHTAPTVAPMNVSVSVLSSQVIKLSWEPPLLEKQNGIITTYQVIVISQNLMENKTHDVSEGRTLTIDMLHPSYNYTVRIAAATVVGIGPFSDPITVMTLEEGECSV